MKKLLCILLLCLSGSVWAAPPCIPGVYGDSVVILQPKRLTDGWYIGGFCRTAEGKFAPWGYACTHGACLSAGTLAEQVSSDLRAANPEAAMKSRIDAAQATSCYGPVTGSLKTVCDALFAELFDKRPWGAPVEAAAAPAPEPAMQYAVKANGTATTRPAYSLTEGVRGTKEVARAAVGQPCKTDRPTLASGSDLWAEFGTDFKPGMVALCSKK